MKTQFQLFLTLHPASQVKEDVYEKIDKELLLYVEDVLLNKRPDATERLLDFSITLDPKSKPCALRRLSPSKVCLRE
jgi:5-methyltetrahydrofolate--homocysteine methyltransferase